MDVLGFGVRYIVRDIDATLAFYTGALGFRVVMHPNDAFAILERDGLRLMVNTPTGPGGGAHALPDGSHPAPGGSNRVQLQVRDLAAEVTALRRAGVRVEGEVITGVGAKQVLLQDPSGNLVELDELLP